MTLQWLLRDIPLAKIWAISTFLLLSPLHAAELHPSCVPVLPLDNVDSNSGIHAPEVTRALQLGLLVELESGATVLEFNQYYGSGHRGIDARIKSKWGPVKRYLWGGEIEIKFDLFATQWWISRANETSSFVLGVAKNVEVENLRKFLTSNSPNLMRNETSFEKYNKKAPHLEEKINPFAQGGNFRHDALNDPTNALQYVLSIRFEVEKRREIRDRAEGIVFFQKALSTITVLHEAIGERAFPNFNLSNFSALTAKLRRESTWLLTDIDDYHDQIYKFATDFRNATGPNVPISSILNSIVVFQD